MASDDQVVVMTSGEKLDSLAKTLKHILSNQNSEPMLNVIEELCDDIDQATLSISRELLFDVAKDLYDRNLRINGILQDSQQTDLKLARRNKSDILPAMAKDITDLYAYIQGDTEFFPKNVL